MGQFSNCPKRGRYRGSKNGRGDKEAGTEPAKKIGVKRGMDRGTIVDTL